MNNKSKLAIAVLLLLVVALSGCSISNSISESIESGSNIISSAFKSSSSSSKDATFEADTAEYTDAFVNSKKIDMAAFRKGIARIADSYGVSDWENDAESWVGIGRGLKHADLDNLEVLNFIDLLNVSELQRQLILDGYQADD